MNTEKKHEQLPGQHQANDPGHVNLKGYYEDIIKLKHPSNTRRNKDGK